MQYWTLDNESTEFNRIRMFRACPKKSCLVLRSPLRQPVVEGWVEVVNRRHGKMEILTNGIDLCRFSYSVGFEVHKTRLRDGWRQGIIRSNAAVSEVSAIEIFVSTCHFAIDFLFRADNAVR